MRPDLAARFERAPAWAVAVVLGGISLAVYLTTLVSPAQINIDAEPSAMPAWHLVQEGTIDLRGMDTNDNPFIVEGRDGRILSNRYPGLWALAVPSYVLTNDASYSPTPSSVTAALLAAAAVGVAFLVLREVVPFWWAVGGAGVLAFATPTWPISAGQLWPHAPCQLLLLLALLGLARGRPGWSGVALGLAVLVRPILGIVPVVLVAHALWQRDLRRAVWLGWPTAVSASLVVAFNEWAFGERSLTGGQGDVFRSYPPDQSPLEYVGNVGSMLLSPTNGILVWSSWLLVVAVGLRGAWPALPGWARPAVLAAAVYVLVHLRLSPATGGLPMNYRYWLEPLVLCLPLLALSVRQALSTGPRITRHLLVAGLTASLLLQGLMAHRYECEDVPGGDSQCSIF